MAPSADDRKPNDKRSYYTNLLIDFLLAPPLAFSVGGGFFLIVIGRYGLFYPKNGSMAQEQNYQVNYTINVEPDSGEKRFDACRQQHSEDDE